MEEKIITDSSVATILDKIAILLIGSLPQQSAQIAKKVHLEMIYHV